ncbi:mitochondrial carrier [Micractinium conductrix]|uniref:Mitochondrial carrier n=1 Tax=Micractinium conductrix TaxID=554055 RepID=A0A2P6VI52_9CHLO|nr:mitochondrial carrier [Micractinium conductrix]|eukprot:PSC73762.1 mitochondrial carrier [Micractinium conductrix]
MAEESAAIAARLLSAPAFHSAPHAIIYVHCAKLREVDTTTVLAEAMLEQKKLYVPRVQDKDANMHFLHLDSLEALQEVPPFGIREPRPTYSDGSERQDVLVSDEPLELVVMPGLAFDRQGRRLGRGGGYYDKFIAAARARAEARGEAPPLLVALAFRAQMVGEVPVEPHDARVDAIVTADEVIACSPGAADALHNYDGLTYVGHMMAGAVAGIGEHVAMFPVDTVKTRMQALAHPGQQLHTSVGTALRNILRREGVAGLYRGVAAMALGAGPSHALYFASYEAAKQLYGGNAEGHQPLATAAAGATATIVNDGCMTPWDVIKQRMQVRHSPYRSVLHCASETWRKEGLSAFYKSYWTTLVMNVPYTALHFAVYESAKKWLVGSSPAAAEAEAAGAGGSGGEPQQRLSSGAGPLLTAAAAQAGSAGGLAAAVVVEDEEEEEGLQVQLVAGGVAGGLAAAATTPLDVVKTRLQLEGLGSATRYNTSSVLPVLRRIMAEEGAGALWRGWQPRVLFHAPSAAICWGIYETSKKLLAP